MREIINFIGRNSETTLYIIFGLIFLILVMLILLISINHKNKVMRNSIYYTAAFQQLGLGEKEELKARARARNIDVETYVAYIIKADLGFLQNSGNEVFKK